MDFLGNMGCWSEIQKCTQKTNEKQNKFATAEFSLQ